MLARLLRYFYLFQLISGALLGSYFSVQFTQQVNGLTLFLSASLGAVLLPLLSLFLVVLTSMIKSRSEGPWGPWWRALKGELKATVQVFILRQPWPHRFNGVLMPLPGMPSRIANISPPCTPVLLVHGYVCNHRVWDNMALALRQAGHPVLAIDLEPLFTSIDDYAPVIERAMSMLLTQTGAQKVALVGHSMGGLAIRAWLRANGATRTAQIANIITLGTPHQGTQIAASSLTANGAQMIWHSDWLKSLAFSEDNAKRALMQIALTAQDNIVFPQRAQTLSDVPVTEFVGLGHLELCLNAGVIDRVCQQLDVCAVNITTG